MITSDRGLAGGYNANVLRRDRGAARPAARGGQGAGASTSSAARAETTTASATARWRETWTGFSEQPRYDDAQEVGDALIEAFTAGEDDDDGGAGATASSASTRCTSSSPSSARCSPQVPVAKRMAPLEVEEVEEFDYEREDREPATATTGVPTSYEFEPSAEGLLDALLPQYINTRIYAALLEAAAVGVGVAAAGDEVGHRQRRRADQDLTRQANQARQAEITQEISEIVGGADALVSAGAGD